MKRFEILEHKADLKIRAFGKDKKDLFQNILFGMSESMKAEIKKPEERVSREIKVKSQDLAVLLVDFLSEVLYLSQTNKEVYFNFDFAFKNFTDTEIEGVLIGQKIERFGEDIKAVTYHELDVKQKEDGSWEAVILFDI